MTKRNALRSLQDYQKIYEKSNDIFLFINKKGEILFANKRISDVLGYTPNQFIGNNINSYIAPSDQKLFKTSLLSATRTLLETATIRFSDNLGTWKLFEVKLVNQLNNPAINGFLVNLHDITSVRQQQEKALAHEVYFQKVLDSIPLIFWAIDTQGVFTFAEGKSLEAIHFAPNEIIGKTYQEVNRENPEIIKKIDRALHGEAFWEEGNLGNVIFETHYNPLKNSQGEFIGVVGVSLDITKRKHIERALQASKNQLDIILKNIADGITVQDTQGKIIYANLAAAHATGYQTVQEMIDAPLFDYLKRYEITDEKGNTFPNTQLPGRRAIRGEINPQVTLRYREKKTGIVRYVIVKSTAIYDEKKSPILVINALHDITKLKEQEQRKDNFMSMASHELKTPLTSIKVYTELLQKEFSRSHNKNAMVYLHKMNNQIDRLTRLVIDLLDLSRIQTGRLEFREENFNLNELVNETIELMQTSTRKHRITKSGTITSLVSADKERISQVLINLLTNAIKYSPSHSEICVTLHTNNEYALVSIRDSGKGIPHEHLPRIFERFYRVTGNGHDTYPGLGIGLYIVKEIISRHKGNVQVVSEVGKGSVFTFSLPLYKQH